MVDAFLDFIDDGLCKIHRAIVPPSSTERLRGAQSEIRRSMQRLNTETDRSLREEQKLRAKMRSEAVRGESSAAKNTAVAIARGQSSRNGLNRLQNRLSTLKSRLDAAKTTESIHSIMQDTTAAMSSIGRSIGGQDLRRTVTNFERQNMMIGNYAEVLGDTVDECEGPDDAESELGGMDTLAEEILSQMMDEINLESLGPLPAPPTTVIREPPDGDAKPMQVNAPQPRDR